MKTIIGTTLALFALGLAGLTANAGSLQYETGTWGGLLDTFLYYEVKEDYTIDLWDYFYDPAELPGGVGGDNGKFAGRPLGWSKDPWQIRELQRHVRWIGEQEPLQWDFIDLVDGRLTVKKGYRWDGASTLFNDWNIADNRDFYIEGSCLHDALYDLMRMGYLVRDWKGNDDYSTQGFKNRLMADCLMQMVFEDDGEDTPINEFKWVRYGGAKKTEENAKNMGGMPLLATWKYHAGELTVWEEDGNVELRYQVADDALKDPRHYGLMPHMYRVDRLDRSVENIGTIQDFFLPLPGYVNKGMESFFTDTDVVPGRSYSYRIWSLLDESDVYWQKRRYDRTDWVSITLSDVIPDDPDPDPGAAPEPAPVVLLGLGLVALGARIRNRRRT